MRILRFLVILAVLGFGLGIVGGFMGMVHPIFDTLSNFRWHLTILLVGLLVVCLLTKQWRTGFATALICVFGIWQTYGGLPIGVDTVKSNPAATTYKLLHINLLFDNPTPEKALETIRESDADILSLVETSYFWEEPLSKLDAIYPHKFHCPEWEALGGGMIFSKLPFTEKPPYCHDYGALAMAEIVIDDTKVEIGSVHLRWPWPASGPRQITALKPILESVGKNAIMAGDFNTASWSYSLKRFANYANASIADSQGGTWLLNPLPVEWADWIGLPIDNILSKGRIRVNSMRTLSDIGSDHLPVLVDFEIAE